MSPVPGHKSGKLHKEQQHGWMKLYVRISIRSNKSFLLTTTTPLVYMIYIRRQDRNSMVLSSASMWCALRWTGLHFPHVLLLALQRTSTPVHHSKCHSACWFLFWVKEKASAPNYWMRHFAGSFPDAEFAEYATQNFFGDVLPADCCKSKGCFPQVHSPKVHR